MQASTSSPFSMLPVALLARVLQHVPQQQRLTCCALVSRDWAAAAAAGTLSISCGSRHRSLLSKCESVGPWIRKHAKQLVAVHLSQDEYWSGMAQLQLPCAELHQLTTLQLWGVQVRLPACDPSTSSKSSSGSSPAIQHMPKLQNLRLEYCEIHRDAGQLLLGPFSGATQLRIRGVSFVGPLHPGLQATNAQNLFTSLEGPDLPQLKRLHLAQRMDDAAWAAATFPPSITALTIHMARQLLPCSVQQLQGLQELHLQHGDFCPATLGGIPQLRVLDLYHCTLLPDATGVDGATVLLAAIEGMQQLRHLVLNSSMSATAQPRSCSALTASSHITHLDVSFLETQPLPAKAVQHMFPAGRLQPHLQGLCLYTRHTPFMTNGELAALITACPSLTSLEIIGALQSADSCNALLQLPPTCRQLRVGGKAFGDSAAAIVAQLTQLTYLQWFGPCSLTDAGLYQLSALQGLEELCLDETYGLSRGLADTQFACIYEEKPVWQQLQQSIRARPSNVAWIALVDHQQREIQRLQQASAQQQQEIQRLRQCCTIQQQEPAVAQLQ